MSNWPPRFQMKEMTPNEAGKFLRDISETTASHSRNWDNAQEVFTQFIADAYKGGFRAGQESMRERAANSVDGWIAKAIRALPIVDKDDDATR